MGLVGDILSPISSLATSAINMAYDNYQQNQQRNWNEMMMERQNQWSLDQWNRTNEYNTPSAQVQRLRDAGLNPMFYGLDGSSANSFESASPLGYQRAGAVNMQNPFEGAVMAAQLSNIRADTAKKSQETLSEVTRREQMQSQIDVAKEQLKLIPEQANLTKEQSKAVQIANDWADRLNEAILYEKEASANLSESMKKEIDELLPGKKSLQDASFSQIMKAIQEADHRIENLKKQHTLLSKDIEHYSVNHQDSGFMGTGLSISNLVRILHDYLALPLDSENDLLSGNSSGTLQMPNNTNN